MRLDGDERDLATPAGVADTLNPGLARSDALLRTLEESDATPAMF